MQKHILIVEDEPAIRDMVSFALRKAGMESAHAGDARGAQSMIAERVPDLILLDWMLPGMSGLELARRLRKEDLTRDVPIIMLTARGEETDRVGGLDAGVDDYVVKPFSPRELIARINAVMRRTHGVDGDGIVAIGGLRIDSSAHRVYARQEPKSLEGHGGPREAARQEPKYLEGQGEPRETATQEPQNDGQEPALEGHGPQLAANDAIVPIGPTEYRLLHFFMTHAERVYSRSQLLDYVWGGSVYVEERTVDVHIRRLRKTLEPFACDHLVQTVRGSGYRFSTTPAE
jgi:two-component system phosphate regulon response regulator PhoB